MPEIITCPDCGRKLRVPDELVGKKVKCPDCKVKFTGSITTSPNGAGGKSAPPRKKTDDDESPSKSGSKRKKADDADADQRVATSPVGKKLSRSKSTDDDEDDDRPSKKKSKRRKYDDDNDEDHPRRSRSRYDDDDEDDRRDSDGPTPAQKRAGWRLTLTGLNLLCYSTYAFLAGLAVEALGCALMMAVGAAGMSTGAAANSGSTMMGAMAGVGIIAIIMYAVVGLLSLTGLVLQITGHGFCMGVPHKIGTPRRPFAIATFSCAVGVILLHMMSCGVQYVSPRLGMVSGLVPLALQLGWFICYFLFLRSVAISMRDPGLGQQCVFYMIAVPVLFVVGIIMYILMFVVMGVAMVGAATSNTASGAGASMGGAFIFGIVCFLLMLAIVIGMIAWYIVIIHKVRGVVRDYVD